MNKASSYYIIYGESDEKDYQCRCLLGRVRRLFPESKKVLLELARKILTETKVGVKSGVLPAMATLNSEFGATADHDLAYHDRHLLAGCPFTPPKYADASVVPQGEPGGSAGALSDAQFSFHAALCC